MTIHDTAAQVLPGRVAERVLAVAGELWQQLTGSELSPAQAEEALAAGGRKLLGELLAAGGAERYGRQQGPRRACGCGGQQRLVGYRERGVMTAVGLVRYRRAYYRCAQCGATHYCGDEAWGLEGDYCSLPAQELVSLGCCELPFGRATELLGRLSGVREECEAFGERLYQEACRRGVERAQEVVAIADGAPWIWNLVAEHFPQAVEILDFFHASERLYEVGKAVYGEGAAAGKTWAEANRSRLLRGQVRAMLRSLRALSPPPAEGREAVRLAWGYFRSHRQRMHYDRYQARGYHIGSGIVEAGCQHVVGARCKGAGMRWTKAGAQHVLALRCLLLSNRWDQHWQLLKAAT